MLTSNLAAAVWALLFVFGAAPATGQEAGKPPSVAELKQLLQRDWPSFARRIREQDKLAEAPIHLTSLPDALCRNELPDTYECVSLVEYQLPSGAQRGSLLRHHVRRDVKGEVLDAILIRETPATR